MDEGFTAVEFEYLELADCLAELKKGLAGVLVGAVDGSTEEQRRHCMEEERLYRQEIAVRMQRLKELEPQFKKDQFARFRRDLLAETDKDAG
jgi:hypothetical protein